MTTLVERLRAPDFWSAVIHGGGQFSEQHEVAPFEAADLIERQAKAIDEAREALGQAVEEIEDLRRYANNHGGMIDDETCVYGRSALATLNTLNGGDDGSR